MSTDSVHGFGLRLVADFEKRGLERRPEVFPDNPTWDRYGDWLRLPGRHHSRAHYTRVWNDEPFADSASSFARFVWRNSQCQADVRKPFRIVLPFGCILSSTIPAEKRHREPRRGARDEGAGRFTLTHYQHGSCLCRGWEQHATPYSL